MNVPSGILAAVVLLAGSESAADVRHRATVVRAHTPDEIIAAILNANSSGRPTIIRVARGNYQLTQSFDFEFGPTRFPPVTGDVSIEGRDADDTGFDAAGLRAFAVAPGGRLALNGITISRGTAECATERCNTDGGGAVLNMEGVLWIEQCVLSNNSSFPSGGVGGALGGAIRSIRGYLHVEDTTIEGNRSTSAGGGLAIAGGSATIRHSIIRGNSVHSGFGNGGLLSSGGLLVGSGATVSIIESTFSANSGGDPDDDWIGLGGAIRNGSSSTIYMKNSSVVENTANPVGSGAGIYNEGRMVIENSTIGQNSAGTLGGGIFNAGALSLRSVTVARNEVLGQTRSGPEAGLPSYPPGCDVNVPELCISNGGGIWNERSATVQLANTVLANNTKASDVTATDCNGNLTSDGRNAVSSDIGCILDRGGDTSWFGKDLTNLDVRLAALQENGKPGNAHMPPLANSPLIDQGGRVGDRCTPRDQIGNYRNDGDADGRIRCDIGAIEFVTPRTPL